MTVFPNIAHAAEFALIDTPRSHVEAKEALRGHNRTETGAVEDKATAFLNMARACYELARTDEDPRNSPDHFRRIEKLADQAIDADPENGEGYKWLAIALGARIKNADLAAKIQLSRRIKEVIEKALSLDPNDDISLLVLSRWHDKIASLGLGAKTLIRIVYGGLPDASYAKAEMLLRQAISIHDRITHRYCLAKVFYHQGKREAALGQLRIALTLPVTLPGEAVELEKVRKNITRW